jgi:methionyl-tRNA formyltransferase
VLVVAAYGLILPQAVLDIPIGLRQHDGTRLGAINIHASLLPRWRGAAPIARAIEAGDTHTGVTIMQMEAGLDTGPMLLEDQIAIDPDHTTASLTPALAALGARLIVDALQRAARGELIGRAQPEAGVTYAHKLTKHEGWLDPRRSAAELARQVRAFDPFPVASLHLGAEVIRVWAARAEDASVDAPGRNRAGCRRCRPVHRHRRRGAARDRDAACRRQAPARARVSRRLPDRPGAQVTPPPPAMATP